MLFDKLREELGELSIELFGTDQLPSVTPSATAAPVADEPWTDAARRDRAESELGDVLFAVANIARRWGINPEEALRKTNARFSRRFQAIEAAVLAALGPLPSVPTPPLLDRDLAGERLGRPAFVMGYVPGRAPSDDRPSFVESGWVHDAAPADQRRFHCDLLDRLAAVHAVDVDAVGLGWLRPQGDPHRAVLDRLRLVWDHDTGPVRAAVVERAFSVVEATMPAERPGASVLLWGDARPANVLCPPDDVTIRALLDWELADWGPPELDLVWQFEMNWMRAQGAGLAPLPGFLDDEAAMAYYAARSGRSLAEPGWYRTFSALKVAVLLHRYLRATVHAGRMPAEHRSFGDNVATRRLDELLAAGA